MAWSDATTEKKMHKHYLQQESRKFIELLDLDFNNQTLRKDPEENRNAFELMKIIKESIESNENVKSN